MSQPLRITDITSNSIRERAYAADADKNLHLEESENPELYAKALDKMVGGFHGAAGAVIGNWFSATAQRAGAIGAAAGAGFHAWGSGARNIEAVQKGRMTATAAIVDTSGDALISGGAAAAGAAIGLYVGSVVPIAGNLVGLVVGGGAGWLLDRVGHEFLDNRVNALSDSLNGANRQ